MNKRQLQFELWKECNSKCKFCYSGKDIIHTLDAIKIRNLQFAIDKLNDKNTYDEFDEIGFIGGEFFQGQLKNEKVRELFFKLMRISKEKHDEGLFKKVWINITLTIGDQKDLYDVLEIYGNDDNLWLLTSYDTKGRFHTSKMEENWKFHMKNIHKLYPNIRFNTTTILSSDFISKYLNDEINLSEFRNEYCTDLFFKVPGKGYVSKTEMENLVGDFFPKRNEFLKFLKKFKETEDQHLWDKLFNIKYRADLLYYGFKDKIIVAGRNKEDASENFKCDADIQEEWDKYAPKILPCGHLDSYSCYIDSDQCALCDKDLIDKFSLD